MTTIAGCMGKLRFITHSEAKKVRRLRHAGVKLYIYQCSNCGFFHFSSSNYKSQPQRVWDADV